MKTLEIMNGVCVRDHLEDGLFPHYSDTSLISSIQLQYSAYVYIDYNEM